MGCAELAERRPQLRHHRRRRAGWQLAEWIVEGEPTIDMLGVDPRRYGSYATESYLKAKNEEAYENVFVIHYPDEERGPRVLRTAPAMTGWKDLAVFGQKFGWERASAWCWKAAAGGSLVLPPVQLVRTCRQRGAPYGCACRPAGHVGFCQMPDFGPGAEAFLGNLTANKLPKGIGAYRSHALTERGGVHSEYTIQREAEDSFYIVSAGAGQRLDHDGSRSICPMTGRCVRQSDKFDRCSGSCRAAVTRHSAN